MKNFLYKSKKQMIKLFAISLSCFYSFGVLFLIVVVGFLVMLGIAAFLNYYSNKYVVFRNLNFINSLVFSFFCTLVVGPIIILILSKLSKEKKEKLIELLNYGTMVIGALGVITQSTNTSDLASVVIPVFLCIFIILGLKNEQQWIEAVNRKSENFDLFIEKQKLNSYSEEILNLLNKGISGIGFKEIKSPLTSFLEKYFNQLQKLNGNDMITEEIKNIKDNLLIKKRSLNKKDLEKLKEFIYNVQDKMKTND